MIFARLGDYSTASHVLEDAMPVDDLLALTLFITAHIEVQLGELQKAEDCFTVALSALDAPGQDYHRFGLNFALQVAQIEEDLRVCQEGNAEDVGTLSALPVECIFSAPARDSNCDTPAQSSKRGSSFDSARLPALSEGGSSPPRSPISPVTRSIEYGQDALTWHVTDDGEDVLHRQKSETKHEMSSEMQDTVSPIPYKKLSTIKVLGGLTRKLSTQKRSASPAKPLGIPPKRTRKFLLPREARVQDDSVQELAGFIADLPRPDQMDARGGEPERSDVNGLADFFRAGPEPQHVALAPTPAKEMNRPGSACSSLYSFDQRADSVRSADLLDNMSVRSGARSPYRYRSGVGSYLAQSSPLAREEGTSYFPNVTSQPQDLGMQNIHPALRNTNAESSWPLTTDVAESLKAMSLHSGASSIKGSPEIPSRKSSLLRPAFSLKHPASSRQSLISKKPTPSVNTKAKPTVGQYTKAMLNFKAF